MRIAVAAFVLACAFASSALAQSEPPAPDASPERTNEPHPVQALPWPIDDTPPESVLGHPIYWQRMPYSYVVRVREAEVRVQLGQVRANETFVSIPIEHRRTFVTTERAEQDRGFLESRLIIPAGSRGYEVQNGPISRMIQSYPNTYHSNYLGPVWCFFIDPDEPLRSRCVTHDAAVGSGHGLVSTVYGVVLPQPQIRVPPLEYQPLVFAEDMRLEYRLRPWTPRRAIIGVYVNGDLIETIQSNWSRGGAAEFELPVGILRLDQDGNNPSRATASLRPYSPGYFPTAAPPMK